MIGSTVQRKIALSAHGVESQALEPEQGTATKLSNKTTRNEKARKLSKAIPFFFRLASNALPDIGTVFRIEKKKLKKKIPRSLGIGGPSTLGRR